MLFGFSFNSLSNFFLFNNEKILNYEFAFEYSFDSMQLIFI